MLEGENRLVQLPHPDSDRFMNAGPFPHIVIDDVLDDDEAAAAVEAFPPTSWTGWKRYGDEYQPRKHICSDIEALPPPLQRLLDEMNRPAMLEWLQELTGIDHLVPDPHLEGGGLHCTAAGGTLTPHTDFHHYRRLALFRRINAILYLNDCWRENDGGELELIGTESGEAEVRVEPRLGRLVVFRTDHDSVHGFTNPVREGTVRRSVATYYYTAQEAPQFSGDTNTYWRTHPSGGALHRARLALYQGLLFGSRSLSWMAHRVNPNLGRNVRAR